MTTLYNSDEYQVTKFTRNNTPSIFIRQKSNNRISSVQGFSSCREVEKDIFLKIPQKIDYMLSGYFTQE
jgi:hypothetical protein